MSAGPGAPAIIMPLLLTFGMRAISASTLESSWNGSAPMRLMMADRLFSFDSSSAFNMWMGSACDDSFSEAMTMVCCNASCAVRASLFRLPMFMVFLLYMIFPIMKCFT